MGHSSILGSVFGWNPGSSFGVFSVTKWPVSRSVVVRAENITKPIKILETLEKIAFWIYDGLLLSVAMPLDITTAGFLIADWQRNRLLTSTFDISSDRFVWFIFSIIFCSG